MTRFIHDRFAKEYLEELLSPMGTVNVGRDVTSEVREIDVYFTPTNAIPEYSETLGLLGKMANTTAIFNRFAIRLTSAKFVAVWASYWTCEVSWSENLGEKILAMMTVSYPHCGFC